MEFPFDLLQLFRELRCPLILGLLDQELHGYHACLGFLENKDNPFDAINKDPDYRVVANLVLLETETPKNLTEYLYGNH